MLNLKRLIQTLAEHQVEFVLIGGMAAVAQGSSHVTADVDICYAHTTLNLQRLIQALTPFSPRPREFPESLPFLFDFQTLKSGFNFTFATSGGDLDMLGEVAGLGGFDSVREYAVPLEVFGYSVMTLGLEGLILAKKAAGRPKDLRMLPELEGLLSLRLTERGGLVEGEES